MITRDLELLWRWSTDCKRCSKLLEWKLRSLIWVRRKVGLDWLARDTKYLEDAEYFIWQPLQSDIQYKYTTGTGLDHSWISAKVDHHYKKFLIDLFRSIILNPAAFYWTLAYHHQVSVCLNFDKGLLLHYWFLNPLKIVKNNFES